MTQNSLEPSLPGERQFCSECRRWVLQSVRTLSATKRLLGTGTGAGLSAGFRGGLQPLGFGE